MLLNFLVIVIYFNNVSFNFLSHSSKYKQVCQQAVLGLLGSELRYEYCDVIILYLFFMKLKFIIVGVIFKF